MEIVQTLYFAICYSIAGIITLLICIYNVVGIVRPRSTARLSQSGVMNWIWATLFFPFSVFFLILGVGFWVFLFGGG